MTHSNPPIAATEADMHAELHRLVFSGEAKKLREESGLTLAIVARSVGADRAQVSRWEKGQRRPTGQAARDYLHLLHRLAAACSASN